jgi:hypothetical protein
MIPEYIRFYGGTPASVLHEYARTYFAMLNQMYSLKAKELLDLLYMTNTATSSTNPDSYVDGLKKQSRGIGGIVNEIRNIKK